MAHSRSPSQKSEHRLEGYIETADPEHLLILDRQLQERCDEKGIDAEGVNRLRERLKRRLQVILQMIDA